MRKSTKTFSFCSFCQFANFTISFCQRNGQNGKIDKDIFHPAHSANLLTLPFHSALSDSLLTLPRPLLEITRNILKLGVSNIALPFRSAYSASLFTLPFRSAHSASLLTLPFRSAHSASLLTLPRPLLEITRNILKLGVSNL